MRYVKYIGLSHARIIQASEWRGVGIDADTVVWSAWNGFAVPLDSLTDKQLEKAIYPDRDFVITGDDEDFEPTPQTRDMTPAQVVQVTEEPVDVVAMLNGDDDVSPATSEASGGRPVPNDDVPDTDQVAAKSTAKPTSKTK